MVTNIDMCSLYVTERGRSYKFPETEVFLTEFSMVVNKALIKPTFIHHSWNNNNTLHSFFLLLLILFYYHNIRNTFESYCILVIIFVVFQSRNPITISDSAMEDDYNICKTSVSLPPFSAILKEQIFFH